MIDDIPPFQKDDQYKALKSLMGRTIRPLALVGAGISVSSGYPTWAGFLSQLKEVAGESGMPPKFGPIIEKHLASDPAWQAEVYEKFVGSEVMAKLLVDHFGRRPSPINEPHHLLVSLNFRHVLTTNFDPCIEIAHEMAAQRFEVVHWSDSTSVARFLNSLSDPSAVRRVVYLHGRFDRPKEIVLTEASYSSRYVSSDHARRKLLAILLTQPVVFLGFSLNDPDLGQLLRESAAYLGGHRGHHYAVMGYTTLDEQDLIRRRFLGKYGVETVFYRVQKDGADEDHSNLIALLESFSSTQPKTQQQEQIKISIAPRIAAHKIDPDDPHKNQWGGTKTSNGLTVQVTSHKSNKRKTWLDFTLTVLPTQAETRLSDAAVVEFYVHPTFKKEKYRGIVEKGQASIEFGAYGAFTVGVLVKENGKETRLELDLAMEETLPRWFRSR